jgi:hypothetical protein
MSSETASLASLRFRPSDPLLCTLSGLKAMDYIGRLKELDMLTLEERRHQADILKFRFFKNFIRKFSLDWRGSKNSCALGCRKINSCTA